jgi:hypothetical protein
MSIDRRTILSLIAMGRITPREAERLLAMWPEEDEFILRAAVCLSVAWMILPRLHGWFTGVSHAVTWLLPQAAQTVHHALACFSGWIGGVL